MSKRTDWRHDAAMERARARLRVAAIITIAILVAATLLGGMITTAVHPLLAALAQLQVH